MGLRRRVRLVVIARVAAIERRGVPGGADAPGTATTGAASQHPGSRLPSPNNHCRHTVVMGDSGQWRGCADAAFREVDWPGTDRTVAVVTSAGQ